MSDTKLLQAILKNQVSMKDDIKNLEKKVDTGFKDVNQRLDAIGKSVAYLEDDAPTRDEHSKLEKRVTKIEKKMALV